jgi:hypothetical protein
MTFKGRMCAVQEPKSERSRSIIESSAVCLLGKMALSQTVGLEPLFNFPAHMPMIGSLCWRQEAGI